MSWDAWPIGDASIDISGDEAWIRALGVSRVYGMPVSPLFYTNLPSYGKNWLWKGETLWIDRWKQILQLQPDLVQIISWNDFGESHYISSLPPTIEPPEAVRYVADMPHDAFRNILPYFIDAYNAGQDTVIPTVDSVYFWYRLSLKEQGQTGGTSGNNPAYQDPVSPLSVVDDVLTIATIAKAPAMVVVSAQYKLPYTVRVAEGIHTTTVPLAYFANGSGSISVSLERFGQSVVQKTGPPLEDLRSNQLTNFNPWAGDSPMAY